MHVGNMRPAQYNTPFEKKTKHQICHRHTTKHLVIALMELLTDPERPVDDFRELRLIIGT